MANYKLINTNPGRGLERASYTVGFGAFLPLIIPFAYGDIQQFAGHSLPAFTDSLPLFVVETGSTVFMTSYAQNLLRRSAHKQYYESPDKLRAGREASRMYYRQIFATTLGAGLFGAAMALNGYINHNDINMIAGSLVTAYSGLMGKRAVVEARSYTDMIKVSELV